MLKTKNYQMNKPELTDSPPDITVLNGNFDIIDETLKYLYDNKATKDIVTTVSNGLMSSADKSKLNGIQAGANVYTHPSTHAATMITEDATHRFVSDTEKSAWNGKAGTAVATKIANGLMSAADKTKLDDVATNANNYTHPSSHPASIITQDATYRFVSDTEKSAWNGKAGTAVATKTANGLMSAADKTKLDGVATNANNYTHPSSHPASIITQDATHRFISDTEKNTWNLTTNSKNTNGYVKLPNGLILQWGRGTLNNSTSSTGFNFATKFPSSCLSVTAAVYNAGNTTSSASCRLTGFSVTSISVANSVAMANIQVTYFAIGY